jgi:hypothetical protein
MRRLLYAAFHYSNPFIALVIEAVGISETSVNFNVTTRRYIPEDSKLYDYAVYS